MGIASLFMPSLMGMVADEVDRAEKLYGLLHILGAVVLCIVPAIDRPGVLFWVMLMGLCAATCPPSRCRTRWPTTRSSARGWTW